MSARDTPCTALLVGGRLDGTTMRVPARWHAVQTPKSEPTDWFDGTDKPITETVTYSPRRIVIFGHVLRVWVLAGLSDEEAYRLLVGHLLNDVAFDLIAEEKEVTG